MSENVWESGPPANAGDLGQATGAPPETPPGVTQPSAAPDPGAGAPPPAAGEGAPPAAAAPAAVPAADAQWTPERVAELLRTVREPAQAQQPQMSQEEMDKLLNVVNVTPEQFGAIIGGGENAVQAFNEVLQAVVLQARTTAWYQSQVLMRQMQQQFAPVMDFYTQAQQDRLTTQFFGEFKEFTPEKHMKLLGAVKSSLDAEGAFKGKSRAEGFKLIAERAKEVLSASGTPLVPVAAAPGNGAAGMAQLSRGAGHGAAAGAGSASSESSTAKRVFGS